jgi:hypothetical protein
MSTPVAAARRFTRRSPCPICGGHADLPQGRGTRCAGFLSADGEYAHCQREQRAGALPLDARTTPPTYAHKLFGPCRCGVTHNPAPIRPSARPAGRETRYELRDAEGRLMGVHVRTDRLDGSKNFRWERHNGRSSRDMPLWRLADHLAAPQDALRIICEGEKAADALRDALRAAGRTDVVALGTVTGASAIPGDASLAPLVGVPVALWPDNDDAGRAHMARIAERLRALGAPAPRWIAWPDAEAGDDAADWLASGGSVADLLRLVADAPPEEPEPEGDDDDDEAEEPPTAPVMAVEPFPLDALPAEIAAFVRTVAAAIGCPPDYVAAPLLVYASAAIGNSARIELKRGWREHARLWLAIVGEPGDRKSPAIAAVHRLVEERQRAHHAAWRAECEQARAAGSEGGEPVLRQLYTSDATIEALADILHLNRRGVLVTRDELSGWALSMNEYKKRGADRQQWLQLWSGAALMVNRRSRHQPLYVEHPFVSVVGGIQPDVLGALCDERGRNDGFVHRLLFVYPDRVRREWTDAEIPDAAYDPVRRVLDALYARDGDEPLVVTLTTRARALWREIVNALYAEADAPDFPDALRGPWAKLEAYVARLALVLHLTRAALDGGISAAHCDETSLAAAADIVAYLKSHARRVYARLIARPEDVRQLRILSWIREHGGACTARDLARARVAGIASADDARAALTEIASRGWGRTELAPNAHGRPTLRITLYALDNMTICGEAGNDAGL